MLLSPTSGVTSVDSAVLGLRKLGACAAVSVGRLTLVEGGAVLGVVVMAFFLSLGLTTLHTRAGTYIHKEH